MDFVTFRKTAHATKEEALRTERLYVFHRALSVRLSWILLKVAPSVRPNQLTVCNVLLVLFGAPVLSFFLLRVPLPLLPPLFLCALAGLYLSLIIDKMDGEVARVRMLHTLRGQYFDAVYHFAYPSAFFLIIASFFWSLLGSVPLLLLTGIAAVLVSFYHASKYVKRWVIKDSSVPTSVERPRPAFPARLAVYLSVMVYDLTLLFYAVAALLVWAGVPGFAFLLYVGHITLTVIVTTRLVLAVFPRDIDGAERV